MAVPQNSQMLPLQKQIKPITREPSSFLFLMMKALEKNQTTESNQQITDAKSTEIAVTAEGKLYAYWNKQLETISGKIAGITGTSTTDSNERANLMKEFQVDQSKAQSNQSQQDGAVQADQGQTSSDATNLQMQGQMVQGANSILSALVNFLGKITG